MQKIQKNLTIWILAIFLSSALRPTAHAQVFIFDESEGFTNETTFVLDDDNAAGGSNLDIIANQGSDSDGTLRYNATTNQWEISNNGGAFNDLASVADIDLDQGYDNFGAAASTITVDAAEGQTGGLTFSGSLAGDETVSVTNSGAGGGLFVENTGAGDSFRVDDVASDTSPFIVNAAGDTGVGTTTPNRAFNIERSGANFGVDYASMEISTTAAAGFGPGIELNATSIAGGMEYIIASTGTLDVSGTGNLIFFDLTNVATRLLIDDTGDIGMGGETAPAHPLDITGTGEVIEIGDGTGTDLIINFDDDDGDQNFGWDDSAEGFSTFGENLNVLGLDVDATSITIDADNTGAGANVDIVAEQGTDSDGTLRYNAAANVWELSNDGGAFNEITTSVTENTLDEAYDQGGAGAGRTITVDSGAVALSGTGFLLSLGNGAAADSVISFNDGVNRNFGWDDSEGSLSTFNQELRFRVRQGSTPPVACSATVSGMQWQDTDTGILYICDTSNSRDKWLSTESFMLTGGETAPCNAGDAPTVEACTQDIHNGTNANDLGFQLPQDATIVGGSFHSDASCTDGTGVDLEVADGDNGGVAFLADILTGCTDANGCSATGTNIDVDADDVIRARLDNNCGTGSVNDWSSIMQLRWRHD